MDYIEYEDVSVRLSEVLQDVKFTSYATLKVDKSESTHRTGLTDLFLQVRSMCNPERNDMKRKR